MCNMKSNEKVLTLIAGPCVIESESNAQEIASEISNITDSLGINYYYKASFDKANRTSVTSFRGPGLDRGLSILQKIKTDNNVKILTDIHEPYQANPVSKVADILQIPAFLCRQTDLLLAAGNTGKTINVKKAQFLSPQDMKYVINKIESTGNKNIMLCERGTFFGYNNLIVDMTSIVEMKTYGYPVVFDATHSVQKPGGNGCSSGGNREYVEHLAKAAIAVGADALFMEVHPNPEHALCDGANMIRLSDLKSMLIRILKIYDVINNE